MTDVTSPGVIKADRTRPAVPQPAPIRTTGPLTGRHVLMIAVTAFAVIIAANMTMLFAATGSFPGLVVKNAYVAGQGWNERTAGQQALGWAPEVSYRNGVLSVLIKGAKPADLDGMSLTALVGRPTHDAEDQTVVLMGQRTRFTAPISLTAGAWRIEITSQGAVPYQTTAKLDVPD